MLLYCLSTSDFVSLHHTLSLRWPKTGLFFCLFIKDQNNLSQGQWIIIKFHPETKLTTPHQLVVEVSPSSLPQQHKRLLEKGPRTDKCSIFSKIPRYIVFKFCIQPQNYAFYLRANFNKILLEFFRENPCVLEFILNFFLCRQNFLKIALKTLWAERRHHAKSEKNLPSESGNNAAESFKFLNILTRQVCNCACSEGLRAREHARRTGHSIFAFSCLFHFVGYPLQIVQLYYWDTCGSPVITCLCFLSSFSFFPLPQNGKIAQQYLVVTGPSTP